MFPAPNMSINSTSISEEASLSSDQTKAHDYNSYTSLSPLFITSLSPQHHQQQELHKPKKKRSQPGNPDPDAEVIALSPKSLMTTNRFVCEICNKGFQRDQNLQLHRRGHNLPWKLRQRSSKEVVRKRVYVCPEESCVHHHPSKALGDLTGIKKHFCRKHGEKRWRCDKCSKRYAVQSDWKAHTKTCGTREYRCDCGTLFSRKDSFITHRAFCDALAEESARLIANSENPHEPPLLPYSPWDPPNPNTPGPNPNPNLINSLHHVRPEEHLMMTSLHGHPFPVHQLHHTTTTSSSQPKLSATALLQKATTMGPLPCNNTTAINGGGVSGLGTMMASYAGGFSFDKWQKGDRQLTRDFLGVAVVDARDKDMFPLAGLGMEMAAARLPCETGDASTSMATTFGFGRQAKEEWGTDC